MDAGAAARGKQAYDGRNGASAFVRRSLIDRPRIHHKTTYRYHAPVRQPHRLILRPRERDLR